MVFVLLRVPDNTKSLISMVIFNRYRVSTILLLDEVYPKSGAGKGPLNL